MQGLGYNKVRLSTDPHQGILGPQVTYTMFDRTGKVPYSSMMEYRPDGI